MVFKKFFRLFSLLLLLISLLASPAGALAASPRQTSGITATVSISSNGNILATSVITVGDNVVFGIDLQGLPAGGLTSAEFGCFYNPTLAEISGLVDAGLFGPGAAATVNGPAGGTFIFAIAGANGNKATVGGTVFRFSLKALAAGSFDFTCNVRVSTGVGLTNVGFTPATITINPAVITGTVNGVVTASKVVTVTLFQGTTNVTHVNTNPVTGSFSLTAPAGTYTIVASAPGHLNAQGTAVVTSGGTLTMPTIALAAGDVDNNGKIEYLDLVTIGINYNKATPATADLNNDGVINVLDLQILAKNYPKTGPTAW